MADFTSTIEFNGLVLELEHGAVSLWWLAKPALFWPKGCGQAARFGFPSPVPHCPGAP